MSGEEWWAWRQVVIATSEECGPAWPEGPATIEALYGMWRMTSDPLHYKLGRTEDSEVGQQHWWDEAAKLANKVD